MNVSRKLHLLFSFAIVLASGYSGSVISAPGAIAESPLFLSSAVQPNIFLLIDDSGSMDDSVLTSNDARTVHPTASGSGSIDYTPNNVEETRELCNAYNVMAYNPARTYTPWAGVDEDGNAYTDRTLTTASDNPYDTDLSARDLSNHFYFPWTDSDNDQEYDDGECPDDYDAYEVNGDGDTALTVSDCRTGSAATAGCQPIADIGDGSIHGSPNRTAAEHKTNYANWYTYYEQRQYVTKKALSEIITRSTARMGLGTLWNNNSVGTTITDVDDITTPVDTTAQAAKANLMRQLFRIFPDDRTPLRQSLERAGNYFLGSGSQGVLFGGTDQPDPILPVDEGGSCQQNFTILLSDGFWNEGAPNVGNADGDNNTAWDGGLYADTTSNTLADVAMKYYETDLDTSLDPDVPTIAGIDSNNQQHMVTYTVAFGVNGSLSAGPAAGAGSFTWPVPVSDSDTTIDDMRHAAYNGRGLFLSASDPDTLISSLSNAIADISSREGTAAAVSFNSTSVQSGSQVFQANFNSDGWHGNLRAFGLSSSGAVTAAWDAASLLDARNLSSNPRQIVTFNGTSGIPFAFPSDYNSLGGSDITTAQRDDLMVNAPHPLNTSDSTEIAENQTYGEDIVAYLRGDSSNESPNGQGFRARNGHRLGDIVQSSPVFVGKPEAPYPNAIEGTANLYSTFQSAQASRAGVVYVGANDGMLHAFDADGSGGDGSELFAYIPQGVYSSASGEGLHALAEPTYQHRYYVDSSPQAADVFVSGAWRTYLIGALRGGGKTIFALDVTNPSQLTQANASSIVKWEFTHNELGLTFSDIRIGRMNNGKWAAIFGNGYNSTGSGTAQLFIHYLDNSGTVILDTGVGSSTGDCSAGSSDCNGMSTPALADLNGDAVIDRIAAGDLHGNMWVFDVSSSSTSNWGSAYEDGSNNPIALFQACTSDPCTAANRQPITSKPALARHPTKRGVATTPNLIVYFGTGQYLTNNDNTSTSSQSFYGVWDGGTFGVTPRTSPLLRANLQDQTITNDSPAVGQRTITQNAVNYDPSASPAEYGWRMDLPSSKERMVVDPAVIGDIVFFNTLIPSTATCSGGGDGWLMTVDRLTGGLPNQSVVDLNNNGDFTDDVVIGGQKVGAVPTSGRFIRSGKGELLRVVPDSQGNLTTGRVRTGGGISASRTSWTHLEY